MQISAAGFSFSSESGFIFSTTLSGCKLPELLCSAFLIKMSAFWQTANIRNLQRTKTDLQEKTNPFKSRRRIWTDTSQKKAYMKPKNMKKYLSSPVIREMQIKTMMRYYLMSVWMVTIKKAGNNRCWRGCGETGMVGGSSTIVEDNVAIPQGSRTRNTIWPSNPNTEYMPKGL